MGIGEMLRDLAGAALPLSVRDLEREIEDRLRKVPTHLNEYGFDPYGMQPASARRGMVLSALLYRHYFRVTTTGIDQVPTGRVLLIANHAGQLPFDAAMLGSAMLLEAEPPRIARGMGEYWIPRIPWFNVAATRAGQMVGTPENCVSMLESGECVMVFPEGARGINKPYRERYRLKPFGMGFLRLALETEAPIVPVGIVGSEEQQPGLANLEWLGRLLGMPAFPLTLGFPWLGPLGILPLPVKYHLLFGAPLRFQGSPSEEDAVVEGRVEEVRAAIEALLERGLAERGGIFRG
jgi:1-acyl-sn-glycerol-3-phosphate acyltransferase